MVVNAVQAKLVSMLAIGFGSFIVGVAPACFVSRVQDLQQRLLLSCTLCFGGGVLLATSILHMLPEVRASLPAYAELVFCCGFLLLYLIDEAVHYFWGNDTENLDQSNHDTVRNRNLFPGRCREHSHHVGYNVVTQNVRSVCIPDRTNFHYQSTCSPSAPSSARKSSYGALQFTHSAPNVNEATYICHGNHSEPCSESNTGVVGLLVALTVHAILEGLAIGLQKEVGEVILLVCAVASHKFVVGFCLGLELAGAGRAVSKLVAAIFVFSGGSSLGIGIGMLTFKVDESWSKIALPILQGLAGGTLLYVTVSEVLPRERARWHRNSRRVAGILQFLSVITGFVLIFLLNNYVGT
ncbi:zinc transporter ZIP1 [Prorops nasuta]|uniref:zinc transporter ZIP1 n=1 Tax=Prorops nasuta TaxID=863751 RepID=UPI0034CD4A0C